MTWKLLLGIVLIISSLWGIFAPYYPFEEVNGLLMSVKTLKFWTFVVLATVGAFLCNAER